MNAESDDFIPAHAQDTVEDLADDHEEDGFLFWLRSSHPDGSEKWHLRISVSPPIMWFIFITTVLAIALRLATR